MFVATVRQVFGSRSSAWKPSGMTKPGMMFPPGTQKMPHATPRMWSRYELSVLVRPM
ncbi:MAG: hypothetical protein AB2L13_09265 [Spirochaetota bacterium]